MKKIIIFLCALAFVLSAQAVLAANQKKDKDIFPNFATSTDKKVAKSVLDTACIQSALDKRESAIILAFDKKAMTIKTALDQRKTDLKAAWALSTLKERIKARLEAWKKFKKADISARTAYRQEIKKIWAQYKTDKKACKITESDNESSGTDNSL